MAILEKVAGLVVEVLTFDPSMVLIGRENYNSPLLQSDTIVIDSIGNDTISETYDYNKATETEYYNAVIKTQVTVSFFGSSASANANKLRVLLNSEIAYQFCVLNALAVYNASRVDNIKALQGSTYNERYDVVFNVTYNHHETVSTLRIDTPQIEIIVNK